MVPSARALFYHNISHFVLSPTIATAITNVASDQDRHEALLQSRGSFRIYWKRLRQTIRPRREPTQSLSTDGFMGDGVDMKLIVIEGYLKDLGPRKSRLDYSTLATACQVALDDRGPCDFQDQVIATITWQQAQLQRVSQLLEHLVLRECDSLTQFVLFSYGLRGSYNLLALISNPCVVPSLLLSRPLALPTSYQPA